jgi:hypothetical protein
MNFYRAYWLRDHAQLERLRQYIATQSNQAGFCFCRETEWAFRRVLSHIEDGWTTLQGCVSLKHSLAEATLKKDWVGFVVYPFIAPYVKEDGGREVPQLGDVWPQELVLAAYIYYATTELPVAKVA